MDEAGLLRARLGRLRQKARYYDRVRLPLHLEAALAAIDEMESRLAALERTGGVSAELTPPAPAQPQAGRPTVEDPALACGFT
jgi:hypothetical protein